MQADPSGDIARAEAALAQGLAASQANDTQTALACFRQACALAPGAGVPQFLLGSEYAASGDMQAAESCFANAVLLSPDLVVARYQLGLLQFSSGRAAAAMVSWQPLLEQPDTAPWPHWVRGFAALAQDLFEEARAHFERGISLNADNPALTEDVRKVLRGIDALEHPGATPGESVPQADADNSASSQPSAIDAMLASYATNRRVH